MTWKPHGWPVENIRRLVAKMAVDGTVVEPWRVSAYKKTVVGDRVWLLRQGQGTRGIFGVGEVLEAPSEQDYLGKQQMMVPVRFSRLVDPDRGMLIHLPKLTDVLSKGQINSQSSGITVTPAQSAALESLLPAKKIDDQASTDWTDKELSALVDDYFSMLNAEILGVAYSKTEHRRELLRAVHRSESSIERKHQNVSSVLHGLGFPWIDGYKPLGNLQLALVEHVQRQLRLHSRELDAAPAGYPVTNLNPAMVFVAPPKAAPVTKPTSPIDAVGKKFDIAKRDARNRALGLDGETFVVALEGTRLTEHGRPDLAAKIRWVSRDEGDGLGYDIASFEADGSEIHIEVKTTRGPAGAAFFVTERERAVAARKGGSFRLYRVHRFGKEPLVYVLKGPLEASLKLRPTMYRASLT